MSKDKLSIGICCYPTFGGSGVVAAEIGIKMAERGHKVHVISYDLPRRLTSGFENIYYHEVEVKDYPLFEHQPYTLNLTSKIVDVCNYEKLDVLHVHYAIPHATSAYLAKQILGDKAPKIITTLHGTDITLVGKEQSYLPITKFSIENSDIVTAPSKYLKQATYEKLYLNKDKEIKVIPNFVNTEIFSPGDDKEKRSLEKLIGTCPIKDDVKIITHVSNFRPVKRIEDVVKSFNLIQKEINSHLILIGDGPERSKAEKLCREFNIHDKVCFLGKQSSFISILRCSDLFLLPSETESFGLAALEAMSCEVPIIATNVGGIPEVVKDEGNGYLVDVGNFEQMATKAIELFKDNNLQLRFSKHSRQIVLEQFNTEKIINNYEELYFL